MKSHSPITIIGAGPAGLACAQSLHEKQLDFKLLSPDLGGKIIYGPDKVPYGSYYIHQTYRNFFPFTSFRKRVWPWQGMVLGKSNRITWLSLIGSGDLPKMMRLRSELFRFQDEYELFKARCLEVGQTNAIQEREYLTSLASRCGDEFLASLVTDRSATYQLIEGNLKGFTFCSPKDLSALEVLKYTRNFILPSYTFHFDAKKFCQPFSHRIETGSAKTVRRDSDGYQIETQEGTIIRSKIVIDATNRSGDVVFEGIENQKAMRPNVSAHLYHVSGRRHSAFERYRFYGFTDSFNKNLLALTKERDGSSLIYVREKDEESLKLFFSDYKIVGTRHWNACMTMGIGRQQTSENTDPTFIRAGALLFEGIEDAWISGVYAARAAAKCLDSTGKDHLPTAA